VEATDVASINREHAIDFKGNMRPTALAALIAIVLFSDDLVRRGVA
jgi:hypothetical protein